MKSRILLLVWLLLSLASAAPAVAAGPGVIQGRLVNGTQGGSSVDGLPVTLLVFRNEQEHERRSATSSPDGSFRFEGLETALGYTYQVVVLYHNVEYGGAPVVFDPSESSKDTELLVYETTETEPGLQIEWAMVVFDEVDRTSQNVSAYELLLLNNPSDRTFLPTTGGPAGPMGLLRFSLPRGASQLRTGPGIRNEDVVQVDRGFATAAPVPPGRHELGFRYVFPYQGDRFPFERSAVYDTGQLWVLAREDGLLVQGDALRAEPPITLAGVRYQLYTAGDLAAGNRLSFTLTGLPTRTLLSQPFSVLPTHFWSALAVAAALAVVAGYSWRARVHLPLTSVGGQAAILVSELATVDDARAAGRISQEEHERRRSALKAALAEIYLAQHHPSATPTSGSVISGP